MAFPLRRFAEARHLRAVRDARHLQEHLRLGDEWARVGQAEVGMADLEIATRNDAVENRSASIGRVRPLTKR